MRAVLRPLLLSALEDPSRTARCIIKLRDTKFTHTLDAPSLALVMPVVRRAFDDRSTETRRCACAAIASIYQMCAQKVSAHCVYIVLLYYCCLSCKHH